ncbi:MULTISPECIES: DUF5330 domain-containing protein [unclassified Agrobacterium]|uniref:DUF5330 domain-containing protein n=1 Tax=Agrobacterium fabrum TaxID=1176649 RepID=A0A2W5ERR7_9HYPH|nr:MULTISPECIES: DUF5330 domain-containing protein [unclassified Agrobacterium]PZP44000.1 MAG: hypothetical protein DI595_20555 [Agrobacterium fabrum]MDH0615284.1 DUF5330 domain-containing protein [Agrobacterium sp. GD03872]MDH0698331.1 DUF5330 domain-containing protein [Agrobacterium sp. GD03871]MDH1060510.1 DUF5330 domain-containing protein [Agrobacterium sp. GD03992]MDH2213927.1 DUF5330 domain-containing protein [Agrobacterium sp. GD03643]
MWFLIKGTFWFSLVLVALSYFGSSNDPAKEPSAFDLPSAVSAAGEAYRYVSAICIEKPDVCVKGAETFHALGERAKEGAKVAYELLDKQLASGEKPADVAAETEKLTAAPVVSVEFPGNTDMLKTGTVIPLPQKRPAP